MNARNIFNIIRAKKSLMIYKSVNSWTAVSTGKTGRSNVIVRVVASDTPVPMW